MISTYDGWQMWTHFFTLNVMPAWYAHASHIMWEKGAPVIWSGDLFHVTYFSSMSKQFSRSKGPSGPLFLRDTYIGYVSFHWLRGKDFSFPRFLKRLLYLCILTLCHRCSHTLPRPISLSIKRREVPTWEREFGAANLSGILATVVCQSGPYVQCTANFPSSTNALTPSVFITEIH